jgi:chorismate synthase
MSGNPFNMPDDKAAAEVEKKANEIMKQGDSVGGIVECVVTGVMPGIGEPVFEKLNANLAKAVMSIGAVKGFEIGDGFAVARATGLSNNDAFVMDGGCVTKKTNHAGGILGGISDGSDIVLRAAFKPTPSISAVQETVNKSGEDIEVSIKGRHDPMIVPRAVVVVESMAAITLVDMIFENMTAKMDGIERFYK